MSYDVSNVFAKILRGELPCKKVYEDEHALAFEDIAPAAPVHVLVIPKANYSSFDDFVGAPPDLVAGFFAAVRNVVAHLGLGDSGYRIITNHGPDADQSVYHFHVHILGGKKLGKLLP